MRTLQEIFGIVRGLLEDHNKVLGTEPAASTIPIDEFFSNIKIIGGTSIDRLKGFSHEDILECIPNEGDLRPRPLAKEIARIFRGRGETDPQSDSQSDPQPDLQPDRSRRCVSETTVPEWTNQNWLND